MRLVHTRAYKLYRQRECRSVRLSVEASDAHDWVVQPNVQAPSQLVYDVAVPESIRAIDKGKGIVGVANHTRGRGGQPYELYRVALMLALDMSSFVGAPLVQCQGFRREVSHNGSEPTSRMLRPMRLVSPHPSPLPPSSPLRTHPCTMRRCPPCRGSSELDHLEEICSELAANQPSHLPSTHVHTHTGDGQ